MGITHTNSPSFVVVDASPMIALCAKELGRYAAVHAQVEQYANEGSSFFAPGVLISETLFVLCGKLAIGLIDSEQYATAIRDFSIRMSAVLPPPNGDASLIERADTLRGNYGCSHSADGIYLALAEELAQAGAAEIITFDEGMKKHAQIAAPSVVVCLLSPP